MEKLKEEEMRDIMVELYKLAKAENKDVQNISYESDFKLAEGQFDVVTDLFFVRTLNEDKETIEIYDASSNKIGVIHEDGQLEIERDYIDKFEGLIAQENMKSQELIELNKEMEDNSRYYSKEELEEMAKEKEENRSANRESTDKEENNPEEELSEEEKEQEQEEEQSIETDEEIEEDLEEKTGNDINSFAVISASKMISTEKRFGELVPGGEKYTHFAVIRGTSQDKPYRIAGINYDTKEVDLDILPLDGNSGNYNPVLVADEDGKTRNKNVQARFVLDRDKNTGLAISLDEVNNIDVAYTTQSPNNGLEIGIQVGTDINEMENQNVKELMNRVDKERTEERAENIEQNRQIEEQGINKDYTNDKMDITSYKDAETKDNIATFEVTEDTIIPNSGKTVGDICEEYGLSLDDYRGRLENFLSDNNGDLGKSLDECTNDIEWNERPDPERHFDGNN